MSGWWFGTMEFYDFPIILGMSSSQLTNSIMFQRGRSTTNQLIMFLILCWFSIYWSSISFEAGATIALCCGQTRDGGCPVTREADHSACGKLGTSCIFTPVVKNTQCRIVHGNFRILKWRYLPYIRPIFQAYVRGFPIEIVLAMDLIPTFVPTRRLFSVVYPLGIEFSLLILSPIDRWI